MITQTQTRMSMVPVARAGTERWQQLPTKDPHLRAGRFLQPVHERDYAGAAVSRARAILKGTTAIACPCRAMPRTHRRRRLTGTTPQSSSGHFSRRKKRCACLPIQPQPPMLGKQRQVATRWPWTTRTRICVAVCHHAQCDRGKHSYPQYASFAHGRSE